MTARRIGLAALLLGLVGGGVALLSCLDTSGTESNGCPSEEVYTGLAEDGGATMAVAVSEYMDRRCGTLDCHGGIYIPMRLYGQYGLRWQGENNISGGAATTQTELYANYGTVCTLEPQAMANVVTDPNSADQLIIVLKARGIVSHKGGAVVKEGDPGDECISGWLRGDPPAQVSAACSLAIAGL